MEIETDVWVAIVGVGGVILGSLVSGIMTAIVTSKQSKSSAEQAEKAQKREEDRFAALTKEAQKADAKERAAEIAGEFQAELGEVQTLPIGDDKKFVRLYTERWRKSQRIVFRRIVLRLQSEENRSSLMGVVDAIDELEDFANWSPGRSGRQTVEDTLTLGFDMAIALERGDVIDASTVVRLDTLADRLGEWRQHKNAIETRRWEEIRRELDEEAYRQHIEYEALQEEAEREMAERMADLRAHEDADREARDAARGAEELMHTYDEEPGIVKDDTNR